jgi:hypothetical protein
MARYPVSASGYRNEVLHEFERFLASQGEDEADGGASGEEPEKL